MASGSLSLYLDGVVIGTSPGDLIPVEPTAHPLVIGGFGGGIMNVGLWNWAIPGDQYQLAGQGLIGALGDGLVGFWPLNGALNDLSSNNNALAPLDGDAKYMACLNCLVAIGPHDATIIEIGNPGIADNSKQQSYKQLVYVPPDASVLSAFVCDLNGGVDFPAGLELRITSPSGVVYAGTEVISDTIGAMPNTQGTSLHALLVNSPQQGYWTIAISVPANVAFHFMMQVFPQADHWQSAMEQTQHSSTHQRHMMGAQSFGGWLALGGTLLVVAGVALAFAPATIAGVAIAGAGALLHVNGFGDIEQTDSLSQAAAKVKATPPPPPPANAWMKTVPDTALLGNLNLPGSHDSAAVGWGSPWTCHSDGIATQLARGIRVLDIRLKVTKNGCNVQFQTCHGDHSLGVNAHVFGPFADVLSDCAQFLSNNPTECIVMSIKIDDDSGLALNEYLSDLTKLLTSKLGNTLYDLTEPAMPTLGQVRGKVYCLNRVDPTSNSVGVPVKIDDNTPDQTIPTMAGHRAYTVRVQDRYDYMDSLVGVEADKAAKVTNLFGAAPSAGLTLNFMSAVQAELLGVYIQSRIIDYIGKNKPAFMGWLMMDYASWKYFTDPYGQLTMIDLVIASNTTPAYSSYPETFSIIPFTGTGN